MEFDIQGNPDYGQVRVRLNPGEKFIAEGGSMAWMDSAMQSKARLLGGFFRALLRKVTGGESMFVGEYFSDSGGEAAFSPSTPGTVLQRTLRGDSIILTAGSFMACTPGVVLSTKFGGMRGLFSGEGLFFLECSGNGELLFNSYGAIIEKEIDGSFIVDTSHVVAWEPSLSYSIQGMGGIKSTLLSGEGLVMNFSGRGKIFLQTRTLEGMASWLSPYTI
jgi:uncharacterized protein (TIGR00266 family)